MFINFLSDASSNSFCIHAQLPRLKRFFFPPSHSRFTSLVLFPTSSPQFFIFAYWNLSAHFELMKQSAQESEKKASQALPHDKRFRFLRSVWSFLFRCFPLKLETRNWYSWDEAQVTHELSDTKIRSRRAHPARIVSGSLKTESRLKRR